MRLRLSNLRIFIVIGYRYQEIYFEIRFSKFEKSFSFIGQHEKCQQRAITVAIDAWLS